MSKFDALLFVQSSSDHTIYVLVYVDDIVTTGNSVDEINCFVQLLHNKFALTDMGELHYFLGIEVIQFAARIFISKKKICAIAVCFSSFTKLLLSTQSINV